MAEAAIGLGTNLGERAANIETACEHLSSHPDIRITARAALYETPPWGDTDQPSFLNTCLLIETDLAPHDLLQTCLGIETIMGRKRLRKWGPRLIDLDVLWYDDLVICSAQLTLPHPEIQNRAFVLVPLAELTPAKALPQPNGAETIQALLSKIDASEVKRVSNSDSRL